MRSTIPKALIPTVAALLLSACGGGGGGSTTPSTAGNVTAPTGGGSTPLPSTPTLSVPGPSQLNAATTYTVYTATVTGSSTSAVAITPLNSGPPDSTSGWVPVTTGAIITYPDGSTQISDSLGNFDAANPAVPWVAANANAIASNPQFQPEIIVSLPQGPQLPLDTTVAAYAPASSSNLVTASSARTIFGGRTTSGGATPSAELTSVAMHPRGVAMFDNEKRTFTLIGSDENGQYIDLTKAAVAWKVAKPAGCSDPSGSVKVSSTDAARAIYTPPTSGTFTCPDLVTATVTSAGGASFSAASNAFWYDPSSGVTWSGTLNDATNKPVTSGLVYLYGGGREFFRGNLVAFTNSSGQFSRTVPPNRTMVPVGGNLSTSGGRAAASFYTLTPSTVVAGASGTTIPAATYTEGGPFTNPYKPLPAYDRALRDAWFITAVAHDQFPFARPNATGKYPKCSIDAIVNKQSDSLACAKVGDNGYFDNWTIATPASGTWVFQEPANVEGGRHALQVSATTAIAAVPNGISDATTKAITCAAPQACFNFLRVYNPAGFGTIPGPISSANGTLQGIGNNSGTILAVDGSFAEIANAGGTNGAFTAYQVRNEYTVGHQTQGAPLYTHTLSYQYAGGGATTINISNNWYNSAGNPAGTLAITFTPGTLGALSGSSPLYTYSGSGTRQYYKNVSGTSTPVTPALAFTIAGQVNYDHSASSKVTLTNAPDATLIGGSVSIAFNNPFAGCPSGYPAPAAGSTARACATLDSPNLPAGITLQSAHIAQYTVDPNYITTVTLDPTFGQQASAFHL